MSGWQSQSRRAAEGQALQPLSECTTGLIVAVNSRMHVRLEGPAQRPVAAVIGDVDQDGAADLQRGLMRALDASPQGLTVDMTGVGFTNSAGLNVLLRLRERARKTGTTLSLRPGRSLARVLEITGTGGLFAIDPGAARLDGHPRARR